MKTRFLNYTPRSNFQGLFTQKTGFYEFFTMKLRHSVEEQNKDGFKLFQKDICIR